MPSSLRFILLLLSFALIAGPVSVALIKRQDERQAQIVAEQISGGRVKLGKLAVERYGCAACHQLEAASGLQGKVGPSLKGVAVRATIAGRLANTPSNMQTWLMHPQAIVPGNAMPDQGIGERDARDIAAYLYTLRN